MNTRGAVQTLNDLRLAGLKEASEKRDVNQLMSWHAKDAIFSDVGKTSPVISFAESVIYIIDSKRLFH
jgi:hypothetical protein